ncbi:MAG TPA: polymer-forming cytoskeletal protein [Thermoanaerobaculia bacterium]|jgi:cytoskeletal protein CcmA (bactofilin family)|nr:polymer-forming cytoskeletal protein [Thermoanaerobaculia bacterium]
MIFKGDGKQSDLNGFLDTGSHINGELRFETTFRVDGKLTGVVRSGGDLVVGEGGEVEGEIEVGQVFVSGVIRGTIRAARRVQITPTGKVFADLETPALIVEDGALFEGRCAMAPPAPPAATGSGPQRREPAKSGGAPRAE